MMVYKAPRALYTILTHRLKYLHAMLYIEEKYVSKREYRKEDNKYR